MKLTELPMKRLAAEPKVFDGGYSGRERTQAEAKAIRKRRKRNR